MTEEQTERLLALMEAIERKLDRLIAIPPAAPAITQPVLNETDRAFYERLYGMCP